MIQITQTKKPPVLVTPMANKQQIKIFIEVYFIMFDEKLKKAEGFILLQNNLMNAVFVKQATPVGDVEALTRYYKSQQTLSELFNEQMGWM